MKRTHGAILLAISTAIAAIMILASVMINTRPTASSSILFYKNAMPEDQEYMMLADDIQGGISYEPYVSEIVDNGWGRLS